MEGKCPFRRYSCFFFVKENSECIGMAEAMVRNQTIREYGERIGIKIQILGRRFRFEQRYFTQIVDVVQNGISDETVCLWCVYIGKEPKTSFISVRQLGEWYSILDGIYTKDVVCSIIFARYVLFIVHCMKEIEHCYYTKIDYSSSWI